MVYIFLEPIERDLKIVRSFRRELPLNQKTANELKSYYQSFLSQSKTKSYEI